MAQLCVSTLAALGRNLGLWSAQPTPLRSPLRLSLRSVSESSSPSSLALLGPLLRRFAPCPSTPLSGRRRAPSGDTAAAASLWCGCHQLSRSLPFVRLGRACALWLGTAKAFGRIVGAPLPPRGVSVLPVFLRRCTVFAFQSAGHMPSGKPQVSSELVARGWENVYRRFARQNHRRYRLQPAFSPIFQGSRSEKGRDVPFVPF